MSRQLRRFLNRIGLARETRDSFVWTCDLTMAPAEFDLRQPSVSAEDVRAPSSVATPPDEAAESQEHDAAPDSVMVRQGDVLLVPIAQIPTAAQVQPRQGRLVLAEGEVTGHAHAIQQGDARTYTTADGSRYLLAKSRAQLIHEEHAPIDIVPGAYKVVIQREYVPGVTDQGFWGIGSRRVVD